ncbi:MAG TPA: insulinase family protein, partial [Thermoanaerobaculia bacterium]|nr:insulinase family protein [Thermoanaerobaculia bacterium]
PLLVLSALLQDGRASRFYRGLVEGREIATDVSGGFNPFQSAAFYEGTTMFLTKVSYRRGVPHEKVLAALDEEISSIAKKGVSEAELSRLKTRILAALYAGMESRMELAVELAEATAFDGAPDGLLTLPARIAAVTPNDVKRAASWLSKEARVVIVKKPGEEGQKP